MVMEFSAKKCGLEESTLSDNKMSSINSQRTLVISWSLSACACVSHNQRKSLEQVKVRNKNLYMKTGYEGALLMKIRI